MVRFGWFKNWRTAEDLLYAEICRDYVQVRELSCRENFMFYNIVPMWTIPPFYTAPACCFFCHIAIPHLNVWKFIAESKHVKSNPLSGWFKAFMRGLKFAEFQGDINQQGGSFIIGPGMCYSAWIVSAFFREIHFVFSRAELCTKHRQSYIDLFLFR